MRPAGLPPPTLSDLVAARLDALLVADTTATRRFYAAREFRPVWTDESGDRPAAAALADLVAGAAEDGLDSLRYALPAIRARLGRQTEPDSLARLEAALTRMAFTYATDLALGRVDPAGLDPSWTRDTTRSREVARAVAAALAGPDPVAELARLRPAHGGYTALRTALARYRRIVSAGGWVPVSAGPDLAPGDRGERVRELAARLAAEGDLVASEHRIEDAVRRFQARHGLPPSGAVDAATLRALNVPAADRARQIEINLERWRWLPADLGARYVMVNAAAFEAVAVENGRAVLAMRAIVGREDWPTPITSGRLTEVTVNPSWYVPRTIAVAEILPLARADRSYLRRAGFRVYRGVRRVDPAAIDWAAVPDSAFPYRFVQAPGPGNPLGAVKLAFDNPFAVALHDTPARALLADPVRIFSHGCVRLERAVDLAAWLLAGEGWAADSVHAAIASGVGRSVALAAPVSAHVVYWTAWADDAGLMHFRPDVYGWDRRLGRALERSSVRADVCLDGRLP